MDIDHAALLQGLSKATNFERGATGTQQCHSQVPPEATLNTESLSENTVLDSNYFTQESSPTITRLDPAELLAELANYDNTISPYATAPGAPFASLLQAAATAQSRDGSSLSSRDESGGEASSAGNQFSVIDMRKTKPDAASASRQHSASHTPAMNAAAMLYRDPKPGTNGRKSRVSVSRMFRSLEISEEQFFLLQAAAKEYMLHPDHPDRLKAVANRDSSNTAVAKLALYGCVRGFIENEGWGERFWGCNIPHRSSRDLEWPRTSNKIISAVLPLLRKCVANERQRQYARESRAKLKDAKAGGAETTTTSASPSMSVATLESNHDSTARLICKLNIINAADRRRIRPVEVIENETDMTYEELHRHIHDLLDNHTSTDEDRAMTINVLSSDGLVRVVDEETWQSMIRSVRLCEWMDGEMKIVVCV